MTLAEALALPYGKQAHEELKAIYAAAGLSSRGIDGNDVAGRALWHVLQIAKARLFAPERLGRG